MSIEETYKEFLKSGELFELLPDAKGKFSKDKEEFKIAYDELKKWQ